MAKYERFEELQVWQNAIKIGVMIYQLIESEKLAKDNRVKKQLIGSAISISNNKDEALYQENKLELVDLSSELKGLIKYLNEFEDLERKGFSSVESFNIPIFKSINPYK